MYEYQQRQKAVYQYLRKNEIDIVICPGFFMPAFKLGESPVRPLLLRNTPIVLAMGPSGVCSIIPLGSFLSQQSNRTSYTTLTTTTTVR